MISFLVPLLADKAIETAASSQLEKTLQALPENICKAYSLPDKSGQYVMDRKYLGANHDGKEHIILEKYIDRKYFGHGNLDDAWTSIKQGTLTFDTFLLAIADIIDALLPRWISPPQLLAIRINPHIKARELIYRADVTYDTPEVSFTPGGLFREREETTTTTRKITHVSKIEIDISPEAFKQADLTFAEAVAQTREAELAERTIVYTRLDELTEKDIRFFAEQNPKEIPWCRTGRIPEILTGQNPKVSHEQYSARERTVEIAGDLPSGSRDINAILDAGGKLIQDNERRKDTIVAVDISSSGETVNIVGTDTQRSWLIRETETVHKTVHSEETEKVRIGTEISEYDYLSNSGEILSSDIQERITITKKDADITESATHYKVFGWNTKKLLGENVNTQTTPTITETVDVNNIELASGESIFESMGKPAGELAAKGNKVTGSSNTAVEYGPATVSSEFTDGVISYLPFGSLLNLPAKVGLGGQVTGQDIFWAAADAVELAVVIAAAIPTGGASIAAHAAASSARTAAKAVTKSAAKNAVKTSGKAAVQGTLKIGGENAVKNTAKQTGKLTLKDAGKAGSKAADAASNTIVRERGLHRPKIRDDVRKVVENRAPRNADGKFIDPNTRRPIDGPYDLGHKRGHEFRSEKAKAEKKGLSQKQFNDKMNNPDLYQIEDPSTNRSHRFEMPRR